MSFIKEIFYNLSQDDINPNIKPVRQKHRHVPHHLRKFVSEKIQKITSINLITPAMLLLRDQTIKEETF
ncbi:hypothetical protein BpHYR1_014133 [Brachionus plicatilis]|uniref:Uncharacterized protein n=1 Tax=Brachionus plicatilis TaxID=10195 RepID=A0A3M7QTS7_BRAPC|nr:hypothetical protein BpHYR1_014133 [Brachionus plicatilis]